MNPVSTSPDSLTSFVQQFGGIANSGDALAILRNLGLSINEALAGAIETQGADLEDKIKQLQQNRDLLDRVAAGESVDGFVVWPAGEADALRSAFPTGDDPFGPFETFIQYRRQVLAADGTTTTDEGTTIASKADWLSDYTRSVNDQGQVVWTKVVDGDTPEVIVFTELKTLKGVPESTANALEFRLATDIGNATQSLYTTSNQLRFTLVEWLGDVRIDERWQKFGRDTEARRSDAQLDTQRQELRALLDRLHEIGREGIATPPPPPEAAVVSGAQPAPPANESANETKRTDDEPLHRVASRTDSQGA